MESLILQLQSNDLKLKLAAIDSLASKVSKGAAQFADIQTDTKVRLYSAGMSLMKDPSPKITNAGFDFTQMFLKDKVTFQPLINLTCDILLVKFGDVKPQIRMRATEVLVSLISSMGIPDGLDKLLSYCNHRNAKAREHILYAICSIAEGGALNSTITLVCSKVIPLLGDAQQAVRKVAVETLAKLHELYGAMKDYESLGVRPTQLRLIQEYLQRPATCQRDVSTIQDSIKCDVKEVEEAIQEKMASTKSVPVAHSEKFSPSSYLSLLFEGPVCAPIRLYSDKDLEKYLNSVTENLSNSEDWEARMKALATLQGLALGDAMEYETFPASIKLLHDLINAQVADLRSTLCKEACRTVAVLARKMGAAFNPTAELLIPSIMKQACVKTQIMASAAERSLKTIITASSLGSQRLISIFFEYASNKALMFTIRRIAVEVLCIASALWPSDVLEKVSISLKSVVVSGVSDADKDVRRVSRQLFWVLHSRTEGPFKREMDSLLSDLEAISQKHIQQEMLNPTADLLQLLNKPTNPPDTVMPTQFPLAPAEASSRRLPTDAPKLKSLSVETPSTSRNQVAEPAAKLSKPTSLVSKNVKDVKEVMSSSADASNFSVPSKATHSVSEIDDERSDRQRSVGLLGGSRRLSIAGPARVGVPRLPVPSHETNSLNAHNTEDNTLSNVNPTTCLSEPVSQSSYVQRIPIGSSATSDEKETEKINQFKPVRMVKIATVCSGLVDGPKRIARPTVVKPPISDTNAEILQAIHHQTETVQSPIKEDSKTQILIPIEELKSLAENSFWESRVTCLENIRFRLQHMSDNVSEAPVLVSAQLFAFETILDIITTCLDDVHHKVASESLTALETCVVKFSDFSSSKLASFLPILFQRLTDRRPHIREKSNLLLNIVRSSYDPVVIVGALAPKILDLPDRTKAAVVQFLCVIVPYASQYFSVPHNTSSMLSKLANTLGVNSKPTVALLAAGTRLLELVYKCAPQVFLSQVAVLPLQQQTLIKKLMENVVSDINVLVSNAGKSDVSQNCARSAKSSNTSSKLYTEVKLSVSSKPLISAQVKVDAGQGLEPKSIFKGDNAGTIKSVARSTSPSQTTSSRSKGKVLGKSTVSAPNQISNYIEEEKGRDLVWILCSLKPGQGSIIEKIEAVNEIKKIAKTGSSEFWMENCAQIVSVLLEAFRPEARASTDTKIPLTGFTPAKVVRGLFEDKENISGLEVMKMAEQGWVENMHISCKALHHLIKYRLQNFKNLMDLLVHRLCTTASYAPETISLQCEQMLSEIAKLDPTKFIRLVSRFISDNKVINDGDNESSQSMAAMTEVTVITLHILASAIKHIESSDLLVEMPILLQQLLPAFKSSLVDVRKALVFVIVEMYFVVGDALYSHVASLTPPQLKLLTIYIDRQRSQRELTAFSSCLDIC